MDDFYDPFELLQPQNSSFDQNSHFEQLVEQEATEISEKRKRKHKQPKKRGAPFKGIVSDFKEEKFKVQRQHLMRRFKQFYEQRRFLANIIPKKRNVYDSFAEFEVKQRTISR